jgi:hypothetical protein
MRSRDYFITGFTKTVERRSKQTKQHVKQQAKQVQKIDSGVSDVSAITTAEQDVDELYRTTIIQKMIAHINSKRIK